MEEVIWAHCNLLRISVACLAQKSTKSSCQPDFYFKSKGWVVITLNLFSGQL